MVDMREQPLKLALVLSGAASLGSFEAGVVYELLQAVALGAPLTIDLVAGSSSGALVAAMAVKVLVAGASSANLEMWSAVDLAALTSRYDPAAAHDQGPEPGLLSSAVLRDLCRRYLVNEGTDLALNPSYPAAATALVMTMTNLDGLPGSGRPGDRLRFGEAVTFTFVPTDPARPANSRFSRVAWERVCLVAQASSAFPGAFGPVYVPYDQRLSGQEGVAEQWANHALLERVTAERPGVQSRMPYADGGIMDNHPVEHALAALPGLTPATELHTLLYDPHRCFLFVEPDLPPTSRSPDRPPHLLEAVGRSLELLTTSLSPGVSVGRALVTNDRHAELLQTITRLARQLHAGDQAVLQQQLVEVTVEPQAYRRTVDAFYDWLSGSDFHADLAWLERVSAGAFPDRGRWLAVLADLRLAYLQLDDQIQRLLLRRTHAALGHALGLVHPWGLFSSISPTDPAVKLLGGQLGHFGAFLSRAVLAHDFAAGRHYASRWLAGALPTWRGPLYPPPLPLEGQLGLSVFLANAPALQRVSGRLLAVMESAGVLSLSGWRGLGRLIRFGLAILAASHLLAWSAALWVLLAGHPHLPWLVVPIAIAALIGVPLALAFLVGVLSPLRLVTTVTAALRRLYRRRSSSAVGAPQGGVNL